jgi:hypothetical protein
VAAAAYTIWLQDQAAGRAHFINNVQGDWGKGGNMVSVMRRWYDRLSTRGRLDSVPPPGRPPKVSDKQINECADEFLAGFRVAGEGEVMVHRGYTSLEAAVKSGHAKKITAALKESKQDVRGLWRRMVHLRPDMHSYKHSVDFKSALSPAQKEARRQACAVLRRWPMKKLRRVIYIDAKKLYVKPGRLEVYSLHKDEVVEDRHLLPGHGIQLYYYAGVNSEEGVVVFVWVTGSTGEPPRYTTYVSDDPLFGKPLCSYVLAGGYCHVHPAHA